MIGWSPPLTHRQYAAWQAWRELQWDRPTRDNFYQMQTACEVRRGYTRNLNHQPGHLRLQFTQAEQRPVTPPPAEHEAATEHEHKANVARSKSRAVRMAGGDTLTVKLTREEAERIRELPLAEAVARRRQLAEQQRK